MTTLILAIALVTVGARMTASRSPGVFVAGICAVLAGVLLWFGLGTLCGWSGPLSQCAVVQ
jgi:hypothetical protein